MKIARVLIDQRRVAWARPAPDGGWDQLDGDLALFHERLQRGDDLSVGARLDDARVSLLAPTAPSKVVAVGLNYRHHAEEMHKPIPPEPLLFLKPSTAVIGPGAPIVLPAGAGRVDHEGELAVVIGRLARKVSPAEADAHILGYTCLNDVTARDIQRREQRYTRAKGFDTFAPIGPLIDTRLRPDDATLTLRVDGQVRQRSRCDDMIFGVPELVAFISRVMTLLPGDVITTGTPSGVGPLSAGQVVSVEVEGVGELSNPVIDDPEPGAG